MDPATRERALELLAGLAADSRAEDGVVDYRVTVDIEDPNTARIFEQYEDRAAAESHEGSDHLAAFVEAFEPHLDGYSELTSFDVVDERTTEGP